MSRAAAVSGTFYPDKPAACRQAVDECLGSAAPEDTSRPSVVAGILPHAGWTYSGPTAGRTFRAIGEPAPSCVVLFGAVHRHGVDRPGLSPHESWWTPLGDLAVDRDLALRLTDGLGALLETSVEAHEGEHAIEVQLPFVARLYPGARILPIAVPPTDEAVTFGTKAGEVFREARGRIVVLGSTDLTHYGPRFYGFAPEGTGEKAHRWSKEVNDRAFLDRLLALDAEGALEAALAHRSACGGGAAAATVAAAKALGAESAELLEHTTSFEVRPDAGEPRDFVGYASVVFR
jgi:AmmeMemoRadiSam system protein B